MKLTHKNLEKVFDYIESQIEDENGRGEFDNESDLLNAVERTIEMFEGDDRSYKSFLLHTNK